MSAMKGKYAGSALKAQWMNGMAKPIQSNRFFMMGATRPDGVVGSPASSMGNCTSGKTMRSSSTHCLRKMAIRQMEVP